MIVGKERGVCMGSGDWATKAEGLHMQIMA